MLFRLYGAFTISFYDWFLLIGLTVLVFMLPLFVLILLVALRKQVSGEQLTDPQNK